MTALRCAVHGWTPGVTQASPPYVEVEPPAPVVAAMGQRGRLQVAVCDLPSGRFRGVLHEATISTYSLRARQLGGNRLEFSAPATERVMRILGDPVPGAFDQHGRQLYTAAGVGRRGFVVGDTSDGKVRRRFVCRDQVSFDAGRVTVPASGIVGGLTGDRIIGAPTRLNLIRSNASFERGTLAGWTKVGGCEAEVVAGGPDGGFCVRVRGPVGAHLRRRVTYSQPARPWGRARIGGTALVKLPSGLDIDDYTILSIGVSEGGVEVWPAGRPDLEAANVTSDMARGSWISDPVAAVGYLPTPPFDAAVDLCMWPVDEVAWTYFDAGAIIRRENTSTVSPQDLTRHPVRLFAHAQHGRAKSDWGVAVDVGDPCGIAEVGTWWHEAGETMPSALDAVCDRGVDLYDVAGPGWRVRSTARQGAVRTDVRINTSAVLGKVAWRHDMGAQRTAARATSQAGTMWGGADEGAVDTSSSDGWIFDVVLSAPVGMTQTQVRAWLGNQLASLSVLPGSTVLLLRPDLGRRLEVGDSVPVALSMGAGALVEWMRITEWAPDPAGRFVAVALGTDPAGGPA